MISDVCIFWHMFLWMLSDILNDLKDMGRIPPPLLSYVVPFFGKYRSPLMTRDLGPPRMDGWTGSNSLRLIGVVI